MPAPGRGLAQLLGTTTFRLASAIVALFVVAAAAIVWLLHAETNAVLTEQVVAGLRSEARALELVTRDGGGRVLDAAIAGRSHHDAIQLYELTDAEGRRIAGNFELPPESAALPPEGGVVRYRRASAQGERPRLAVVLTADVGPERRLVVGRDIEDQRGYAERVRRLFLLGFGGLALVGLAGGLLMSRVVVRRIDQISAAARSIMAGDLSRRIETTDSGDEIDDLAANLNSMLDRIEQLMGGLREVSDNIAHDLKTPLTRLRARAEAALRGDGGAGSHREGLERIIEEADELIKTFNALLLIARLEAGAVEENMETFDLSDGVRDVAELYEPVAEEHGLSIAITAAGGPRLRANRQLIGQAVANLIDNAIKYGARGRQAGGLAGAAAGSPIDVGVTRSADGVEISVADRGPGIAAADRERALKRFVRLERSRTRPGTGLGLSLVAAVARIHNGKIRLEDAAAGQPSPGLKVVVWLPDRLYAE